MPRALVMTLGLGGPNGEGLARALAENALQILNPDRVLIFTTERAAQQTLPHLKQHAPQVAGRMDEPYVFDFMDDVNRLFTAYRTTIQEEVLEQGFAPGDVVVDFTSGTKPMSSALALAALHLNIAQLNYVAGERGPDGRTQSGTERSIPLRPRPMHLQQSLVRFEALFDRHQYPAAQAIIASIRADQLDANDQERVDLYDALASFYAAWDRFDLDRAKQLKDGIDMDAAKALLPKPFADRVYRQRDWPGRMDAHDFAWTRFADLVENAERRAETGAYDDAMARLYRAFEFLAQARLHHAHDLNTDDLRADSFPEDLRAKYANEKGEVGPLGMVRAYELLDDLDDALGQAFFERYEDGELKRLLNKRNLSILAHGFNPVEKGDYTALRDQFVPAFAEAAGFELEKHRSFVRFPTFGV